MAMQCCRSILDGEPMPEAGTPNEIRQLLDKTKKGDRVWFDGKGPLTVTHGPVRPMESENKYITVEGPSGEYDIVWGERQAHIPEYGLIGYFKNETAYDRPGVHRSRNPKGDVTSENFGLEGIWEEFNL